MRKSAIGIGLSIIFSRKRFAGLSAGLHAKFLHLFSGKYASGNLDNDLGDFIVAGKKASYGRLYNGYVIRTASIAPDGWHIPTLAELDTLSVTLGGNTVSGGKLKSIRTEPIAHPRWDSPNVGATNESGFDAFPSAFRDEFGGFGYEQDVLGTIFMFWCSTTSGSGANRGGYLHNHLSSYGVGAITLKQGAAVRLIRNNLTGYSEGETLTDPDGNVYDTVRIGDQVWTVQNYASTKLADGTDIPNVTDGAAWAALTTGAYCNYDNDESHVFEDILVPDVITVILPKDVISYGRLYNQYAIADVRGIAPAGWRVPSGTDLDAIRIALGGNTHLTGAAVRSTRTSPDPHPRWDTPNINANNTTGFSGLPGGFRHHEDTGTITSQRLGLDMYLWSSTVMDSISARGVTINTSDGRWVQTNYHRRFGFSIRMLRNSLAGWLEGETVTDPDGNVYNTVRIGDQVWTVQNWASKKYANGDDIPNVTDATEWISLETGAYCDYNNDESYSVIKAPRWTTKPIPVTTKALFTLPASQLYLDADTDGFWADGQCDVNRLISYDPPRTIVHYDDHPPHNIKKIGILKPGEVLTRAEEDELSRYFRLPWWRFGYFNYFGYWKANMLVDEVREWEAPE